MAFIRNISRILIGIVFIFSGFVKAVDPLGSTFKFEDYFISAFKVEWAVEFAFPLAILLAAFEFIVGIALFFNLKMRLTSLGALLFMLFFTPLTLYIAIENPVTDCGCFGDALVISNWATFYKNLFFLLLAFIVYFSRRKFRSIFTVPSQWIIILIFISASIGLSVYCYKHLPIMDFRPFKIGTDIKKDGVDITNDFEIDTLGNIIPFEEYSEITLEYNSTDSNELVFNFPFEYTYSIDFYDANNTSLKRVTTNIVKHHTEDISDIKDTLNVVSVVIKTPTYYSFFNMRNKETGTVKEVRSDKYLADTGRTKWQNSDIWEFVTFYEITNINTGEVKEIESSELYASEEYQNTEIWKQKNLTREPEIKEEGFESPIHDFNFTDEEGYDITLEMLYDTNYTIILSVYDIAKTNIEAVKEIAPFLNKCLDNKVSVIGATKSRYPDINSMKETTGLNVPFYQADEIMLKTMVRANPGIVLLKHGVVINKWHYNDLPSFEEFTSQYLK